MEYFQQQPWLSDEQGIDPQLLVKDSHLSRHQVTPFTEIAASDNNDFGDMDRDNLSGNGSSSQSMSDAWHGNLICYDEARILHPDETAEEPDGFSNPYLSEISDGMIVSSPEDNIAINSVSVLSLPNTEFNNDQLASHQNSMPEPLKDGLMIATRPVGMEHLQNPFNTGLSTNLGFPTPHSVAPPLLPPSLDSMTLPTSPSNTHIQPPTTIKVSGPPTGVLFPHPQPERDAKIRFPHIAPRPLSTKQPTLAAGISLMPHQQDKDVIAPSCSRIGSSEYQNKGSQSSKRKQQMSPSTSESLASSASERLNIPETYVNCFQIENVTTNCQQQSQCTKTIVKRSNKVCLRCRDQHLKVPQTFSGCWTTIAHIATVQWYFSLSELLQCRKKRKTNYRPTLY